MSSGVVSERRTRQSARRTCDPKEIAITGNAAGQSSLSDLVETSRVVTIPSVGTFVRISVRSTETGEEFAVRYELCPRE